MIIINLFSNNNFEFLHDFDFWATLTALSTQ